MACCCTLTAFFTLCNACRLLPYGLTSLDLMGDYEPEAEEGDELPSWPMFTCNLQRYTALRELTLHYFR